MGKFDPQPTQIEAIDEEFAKAHIDELYSLVQLIPGVEYRPEDLMATRKADGRIMHAKWQHSYALFDGGKMVGFVMGYEREAENNDNYPNNSLYISELAVDPEYRHHGFARQLLARLIGDATKSGLSELSGELEFSIQTNAADWNEPVRKLYKSFGFEVVGQKLYPDRSDVVMKATAESASSALSGSPSR